MSKVMFETAILAGAPLILVQSFAPDRDARTLASIDAFENKACFWWSLSQGLTLLRGDTHTNDKFDGDPQGLMLWLSTTKNMCVFTTNLHLFEENKMLSDVLYSLCGEFGQVKQAESNLVLIGSQINNLPTHITSTAIRTEVSLPDASQRAFHISRFLEEQREADKSIEMPTPPEMIQLIESSASLTSYEIEQTLAMSLVEHGKGTPHYLRETVKQKMSRVGCLRWLDTDITFDDVVGFDDAKTFLLRAAEPTDDPRLNFKGALFLGVPGGGKSMLSKALGNALGVPTILFNLADLLNSLVGKSEENLKEALSVIDSLGRCVVLLDEIEKFVGGKEHDSGVQSRQLGVLLTWMNDRTSPAIMLATCNAADKLPPEFTRAQRWDVIYFVDVPTEDQVADMIGKYGDSYGVEGYENLSPLAKNWTGAEIEQAVRHMKRGFSASEAAGRIVPIVSRMGEKLTALREFARTGCVDVNTGRPYGVVETANTESPRRGIKARPRPPRKLS